MPRFSVSALLFLFACSDYEFHEMCESDDPSFDIEEVSSLEDAAGAQWWVADAIVLDHEMGNAPEGSQWRVVSVDVLMMVSRSQAEGTTASPSGWETSDLTVEVFDSTDPNSTDSAIYSTTQTVDADDLAWEDHVFGASATLAEESDYVRAWWNFDFSTQTSGQGMESDTYVVGISWPALYIPEVGYSAFNRPCDRNWQVNADGSTQWQLNSVTSDGDECSWPMMRVHTQVFWESKDGC